MSPSWPGLHRRLILLISQPKEARTVPPGTGDSKRDFGEAVIGLPVPGKPVSHYRARFQFASGPNWPSGWTLPVQSRSRTFDPHLPGFVIEIAKMISLDAIGDDCKQQVPR